MTFAQNVTTMNKLSYPSGKPLSFEKLNDFRLPKRTFSLPLP